MAGLLYLPRLFVYHCNTKIGSETSEIFKLMERRLLKLIMNPSMMVTIISGILLIIISDTLGTGLLWLPLKLGCVIGLMIAHMAMSKWRRAFESDKNYHSEKFYRIINEIPTVLMISVVVLVVVKPV